jgi:hypothetical protein
LALALIAASAAIVGPALAGNVGSPASVPPALSFLRIDGAKIAYRAVNPKPKGTPPLLIVGTARLAAGRGGELETGGDDATSNRAFAIADLNDETGLGTRCARSRRGRDR